MFPSFPKFRTLTDQDRERYNFYYYLQGEPNSDYCFSVIQSWLAYSAPVEVSQIDEGLIVIRYKDVLLDNDTTTLYALIGKHKVLDPQKAEIILQLTGGKSKLVLSAEQLLKIEDHLTPNYLVTSDLGLNDYIYSVDEYSELDKPDYRRIRREMNSFNRDHPDSKTQIEEVDINNDSVKARVINTHHSWENTYKFQNDPERVEGKIMAKIISESKQLGVNCLLGVIDGKTEGIFLYSELKMKSGHYINLHHARFSYDYKFVNDYLWVLLAKHLKTKGVEYINFERDANIEGLRQHKQLLKPKRITSMHLAGQFS
ncbi:MAG: phosphatidylglycerol lysyltransferase domain-containing protein [Candidatus Saccharibacteria bacterium]